MTGSFLVTTGLYKISELPARLQIEPPVKPKNFLSVDNKDEIEAIFSDYENYFLHEFIDKNKPLQPIIDFDLPQEVLDTIKPKLIYKDVLDSLILAFKKTCLKDSKIIIIASSNDVKKMSYHISTFGMKLNNIIQVALFTKLIRKKVPVAL
ncbi:hypothetical protein C1646_764790 [Rhizophagus diaphanus]|nr:hypothetical protein C1646_764790 [Rhizophagus diaphanus] [Rhizophagus sp. MUCL 43196]